MPTPLHVGLLGQRFMGRAHSNAWGQAARFFDLPREPVLDTVAARDGTALAAFAQRFGWRRWTTQWRELIEDERIELVDVGTPNDAHAEPALAALAAGKHVACEKPLAGTLEDARRMRDAARAAATRGVRTFVWFNYRRCPAVGLAWRLVREGRLGRVRHVRATYLQSWGGPQTPISWRFQRSRAGSGALGDLAAHSVDLARFLVGEDVVAVHGALERTFVERRPDPRGGEARSDVDDQVLFLASFAGGASASFEATRLATGHDNRNAIELDGEHASLRFDFEDMNVLELYDAREPSREAGWRRISCTRAEHPWVGAWWPPGHGLGYEHGFVNMAADVVRALAGTEPEVPLPDFEDAWRTQRVLEAARRAAAQGRAVPLEEVG
jgi:predicted dehydrogenase